MRLFKRKTITYQIDEISIYNAYMLLDTSDYKYLIKKGDGKDIDLESLKLEVFDKYIELSKSNRLTDGLRDRMRLMVNDLKIKVCAVMVDSIISGIASDSYFDELKTHRIVIDKDNVTQESINKAIQYLQVEQDKISDLRKKIETRIKEEVTSIYTQSLMLSKRLELGYKIDVRKTTMIEWFDLIEQAKRIK
tara:strand:- start:14920 stop:15495 length:576 start_codon:yes stop_codon:yes gene_type:complete